MGTIVKIPESMDAFLGVFELASEYLGKNAPIDYRCRKCGAAFSGFANSASKRLKCPECARREAGSDFADRLAAANPSIVFDGEWRGQKTASRFRCLECGHAFTLTPSAVLKRIRHGGTPECPECAGRTDAAANRRLEAEGSTLRITSSSGDAVRLECLACGASSDARRGRLFQNDRKVVVCQKCSTRRRLGVRADFAAVVDSRFPDATVRMTGRPGAWKDKIAVKCRVCGREWSQRPSNIARGSGCPECAKKSSAYERELRETFDARAPSRKYRCNARFSRGGERFEADLFFEKERFAVEFHGMYWHSEAHKDAAYHARKADFFAREGIRLIQIFESEWLSRRAIASALLLHLLGESRMEHGRRCAVAEFGPSEAGEFMAAHHIGGPRGGSLRLGLLKDGEPLSAMSIGASRFGGGVELVRYAVKPGVRVAGGFEKLLAEARRRIDIAGMTSFVDRRWFSGAGYERAGFSREGVTPPGYVYFRPADPSRTFSRMSLQKHKMASWPTFDPSKTEHENALAAGLLRIYDAGHIRMKLPK